MENNNVEKQTNESNPKSTRKIAIWCCVAAAICLVIATALVMHFRNSDGTIVSGTDTAASGRDSDQLQGSETEEETEAPKPEFEISEAGVLTAYNGDDETVVIPDNVISIGAYAFGASPKADAITTVKLGKSVEDIDVQAFVSLKSLEDIAIDEANNNFVKILDGVVLGNNGKVFIIENTVEYSDDIRYYMRMICDSYIEQIKNLKKDRNSSSVQCVLGNSVIEISYDEVLRETSENPVKEMYFVSVNANGQKLIFDEPFKMFENMGYYTINTHEGFVFSRRSDVSGFMWILTENEIIQKNVLSSDENIHAYNQSVISLYKGENGELKYSRSPNKYVVHGGTFDMYTYSTGFDEFVKEIGTAKVESGKIVYYPEETFTVKQTSVSKYLREVVNPAELGYANLEEMFADNARKYGSAK